ncbi:hypothetical protein BKA82DRAFT_4153541 [Pisolithus tinctorius]|nr:hypothetical protein BKA82DRAFT_4153541 [Pisolithus tinctorius]
MKHVPQPTSTPPSDNVVTRSYQLEMLEASLIENIIVAQDTGSGKTHIAVLRIKTECERQPHKVSWFVAPTVTLCEQQHDVISKAIGLVGLIHGGLEPKQWTDPELWNTVMKNNRVIVSTPQVLLDALSHGYVSLGKQIALLVFDEAHHAVDNHPMNCIMRDHYFSLPVRQPAISSSHGPVREERPMVLGLTASPMFGGHDVAEAFRKLEMNLDSVIRRPRRHLENLADYVHRPTFRHVMYSQHEHYFTCHLASPNLQALKRVVDAMDIEQDPYVLRLRENLCERPPGPERQRLDQKLSKVIHKKDSYTHKGLRNLEKTAHDICYDLGPWASDWFVQEVVDHALQSASPYSEIISAWQHKEKAYLIEHLNKIKLSLVPPDPETIDFRISDKVQALLRTLAEEKARSESSNEPYSGLLFVTRRDAVLALSGILKCHPRTRDVFRIGTLVGTSESSYRTTLLDITRKMVSKSQSDTLTEFRSGDVNLVVATAVAEEGLDIQACGNVIRWDLPSNMASWVQSRGRARRKRSSFVLMFEAAFDDSRVGEFENQERAMEEMYNKEREKIGATTHQLGLEVDGEDTDTVFRVESTGAVLTLSAAISHLNHFCSILPATRHENYQPLYDIDPPDMPEGWHSFESRPEDILPWQGPFGCTLTLPKVIDAKLRVHVVERVHLSKRSAYQHAAFQAYVALYRAGLLNDHLLPLVSIKERILDEDEQLLRALIDKRSGLASVARQLNPWQPTEVRDTWWSADITVHGLPSLTLFAQVEMPTLNNDTRLTLYHPVKGPLKVTISPAKLVELAAEDGEMARHCTRRLFWTRVGSRMTWEHLDFAYLFMSFADPNAAVWEGRREWCKSENGDVDSERVLLANAESFGKVYNYPTDIAYVREGPHGKACRFIGWQFEKLSPEDEEELRTLRKYSRIEDLQVTYPLLIVEPIPKKIDLLLQQPVAKPGKHTIVIPKYCCVELCSPAECEYSYMLPSILRHLTVVMTVESLRRTLFVKTPGLASIPTSLLIPAITAPAADDHINYQRLESLGDAVLKFVVAVNLMAQYPLWPEGYLTQRKDQTVNNGRLAKAATKVALYKWIIRTKFTPRKYTPLYLTEPIDVSRMEVPPSEEPVAESGKSNNETEQLSTKMLADVVESLIGAAYLHGGFNLGIECARLFQLGLSLTGLEDNVEKILGRVEPSADLSGQLVHVEQMIGYTFQRKLLLIEALTHASYHFDTQTVSYERMEFLGDALLDMFVIDYLYHFPGRAFTPGQMHIFKAATVNTYSLAYRCLQLSVEVDASMPMPDARGRITLQHKTNRVHLYQCLLHSSTVVLEDQKLSFRRFENYSAEIEEALNVGKVFPWAALTRLQPPKFLSDMIESIIGAVYLDSGGNIETVRTLLRTLGIMDCLERVVREKVDVLHPVSRLGIWVSQQHKQINYEFKNEKGNVVCTIKVEGLESVQAEAEKRGRASQEEARFAAAEKAIAEWGVGDMWSISKL